jgi:4-hydroxybenzoate polyprenyltransferase
MLRASRLLLATSHPGPVVAVTVLTTLLGYGYRLEPAEMLLVAAAVLAGQLTIGWSNDLIDLDRDRAVGRADKPLALGKVSPGAVRTALVVAAVGAVGLSVACGLAAGVVHLVLVVGSGWAYNLGLKGTGASFVPYTVGFGALPHVVALASAHSPGVDAWVTVAAALLGVGVHLVNALPDLADDAATGVAGLPHRLGEARLRLAAAVALLAATVVCLLGAALPATMSTAGALVAAALAVVLWRGRGRVPFVGAIGVAALDVMLLVIGARSASG